MTLFSWFTYSNKKINANQDLTKEKKENSLISTQKYMWPTAKVRNPPLSSKTPLYLKKTMISKNHKQAITLLKE